MKRLLFNVDEEEGTGQWRHTFSKVFSSMTLRSKQSRTLTFEFFSCVKASQDTGLRNPNTRCGRLHDSATGSVSLDHGSKSIMGCDAVRAFRDSTDAGAAQSNRVSHIHPGTLQKKKHRGAKEKQTEGQLMSQKHSTHTLNTHTQHTHSRGQAKSRILELTPKP
jgi:hypothetical protein